MIMLLRRRPPRRRPPSQPSPATHPKVLTMSLDSIQPTRPTVPATATARDSARFSVPRGLIAGTLAAALVWGQYALLPSSSRLSALVQSGVYVGLIVLTISSRRAKVLLIRVLQ